MGKLWVSHSAVALLAGGIGFFSGRSSPMAPVAPESTRVTRVPVALPATPQSSDIASNESNVLEGAVVGKPHAPLIDASWSALETGDPVERERRWRELLAQMRPEDGPPSIRDLFRRADEQGRWFIPD